VGIDDDIHDKSLVPLRGALFPAQDVADRVSGSNHQTMVLTDDRVIVIKPGFIGGNASGANTTSCPLGRSHEPSPRKRSSCPFSRLRVQTRVQPASNARISELGRTPPRPNQRPARRPMNLFAPTVESGPTDPRRELVRSVLADAHPAVGLPRAASARWFTTSTRSR
jgi:hypothetical protein